MIDNLNQLVMIKLCINKVIYV